MKIAIVGAGISGLSLYLFLRKNIPALKEDDIRIYEQHQSPRQKHGYASTYSQSLAEGASFVGGGLGVAPNGMRILRKLNPQVHDAAVAQGYPVPRFQFKTSHNQTLGSVPCVDLSQGEPEHMVMTSRQGFWVCLRNAVPDEALHCGKSIVKVSEVENGRYVLEFSDASKTEEFDIIVGADGVKSVVKKAVLGDGDRDDYPPIYKGLVGVGGFMPTDMLSPVPEGPAQKAPYSPVVMTFGAEGFFGYAPSTSPSQYPSGQDGLAYDTVKPFGSEAMWWSTYSETTISEKNVDDSLIRQQLLERHAKWKDPVIQKIVHGEMDIQTKTQTWVTPKLPTWVRGGLILIGDAAHALPSTSGQGASQALEDAQALSLLLSHHLGKANQSQQASANALTQTNAIHVAAEQFCSIRKARVEAILDAANRIGEQKKAKGLIGEWMTYVFMWAMLTFFPNLLNQQIMKYSVEKEVEQVIKKNEKSG